MLHKFGQSKYFQQRNWNNYAWFFCFHITMRTETRPWKYIYHHIGIPRPKSHGIEIPRPKNRDIEIRGLKHHDIEKRRQISHDIVVPTPRRSFRGQKATASRFQDQKTTTSTLQNQKATTMSSCGILTLIPPDNLITSRLVFKSRLEPSAGYQICGQISEIEIEISDRMQ